MASRWPELLIRTVGAVRWLPARCWRSAAAAGVTPVTSSSSSTSYLSPTCSPHLHEITEKIKVSKMKYAKVGLSQIKTQITVPLIWHCSAMLHRSIYHLFITKGPIGHLQCYTFKSSIKQWHTITHKKNARHKYKFIDIYYISIRLVRSKIDNG